MMWTENRFRTDAVTLAQALLGCALIRHVNGDLVGGIIVETEAYLGTHDRAAHSFGGRRTPRVESMYGPAGHAYVYLIYGIHHCFNVVCGEVDEPTAVLIRAIEPTVGLNTMKSRRPKAKTKYDLCSGPGKLCYALDIDRRLDGHILHDRSEIWIEDPAKKTVRPEIQSAPRVGVDYAGEWAKEPLRFCVRDSKFVSVKPRLG